MKNLQDHIGTIIGFFTPILQKILYNEVWNDWVQPIVLSAVCAAVGFGVTQLLKFIVSRRKKKSEVKYQSNGHGK